MDSMEMDSPVSTESSTDSEKGNLVLGTEFPVSIPQLELLGTMDGIEKYSMLGAVASVLPYATLRTRQSSCLPVEEHASAITSHLKLNDKLIQNDPRSHKLRLETLKAMPQSLTIKRSVKSKLQETVAQKSRSKTIGYWKWFKYRASYTVTKIHCVARDTAPTLELWYHTLKSIEGQCGSGIAAYFKFLRWLVGLNIMCCIFSISFVILPQALKESYLTMELGAADFLTGSGFFTNTVMYYGFYSNDTVGQADGVEYSIPSAYFMTLSCCYGLTLIVLSIKVAQSYRKCYVEISGKVQNMYSNKIFCGWDFSISSSRAAHLHSASLFRDLKELLAEAVQRTQPDCTEKLVILTIKFVITLIVLAMICGTAILLWSLLHRLELDSSNAMSLLVVPIVVTIIMQLFPAIISYLARLENYGTKRAEVYVTVIRIHAMAATVIGTHLAFWITNSTSDCWQTRLGEEIYRLVLLDFIFGTFGVCVLEVVRFTLYNSGWKWIGRSEFDIARNTLNLIYNQTLFWLGFYFSPLMSIIILIKMIVIFYGKKYGLSKYYQPPSRPWRAAQTETLFLALAFLGMIGVLMALGYIVTRIESKDCGPFRDHENTWDYVIRVILSLDKDSQTWKIISELGSPATGAIILISMSIGVYCLRAKVEASKAMLSILREMLILQARDKEFLMKSITKIASERALVPDHAYCPESSPPPRDVPNQRRATDCEFTRTAHDTECIEQSRRRTIPLTGHRLVADYV